MHRVLSLKFIFALAALFFCVGTTAYADTVICTLGNSCAASPETVTVSAIVGSIPSIDPSGGGGGAYQSGVRFSGIAYPQAVVTVQKRDGTSVSVTARADGSFSILVPETQWQLFTLFAVDTSGRRSTLLNFPTMLYSGYVTDIAGIKFAPTITTDKLAVKKGDFISIEGSAVPDSTVDILFEGFESRTFSLVVDSEGVYNTTIPASFTEGEYVIRARYPLDSRTSKAIRITIGTASILRTEATTNIPGDCNVDQRITLVDFSVLAYWYGKSNPPRCVDANSDGVIDLTDFSIVAFYWNG
jgi:hypothetical protein